MVPIPGLKGCSPSRLCGSSCSAWLPGAAEYTPPAFSSLIELCLYPSAFHVRTPSFCFVTGDAGAMSQAGSAPRPAGSYAGSQGPASRGSFVGSHPESRAPSAAGSYHPSRGAVSASAPSQHLSDASGRHQPYDPPSGASHHPPAAGSSRPAPSERSYAPSHAASSHAPSAQREAEPVQRPFAGYQEPDPATFKQMLLLNVGGVSYETTLGTLLKYPQGRLGMMFQEPSSLPRDAAGRLFIDRNGALFQYVLDFLREGAVHGVAADDAVKVTQICTEFMHYGLPHVLPFEELFGREDMTAYSAGGAKGRAKGASFTHIRIVHDPHGRVVNIHTPEAPGLPAVSKPDTASLDAVLEHYGAQGYSAVGCSPGHDGLTQVLMRRDTSKDREGTFPSATGARMGTHPSSDRPATANYDLPPQVQEILGRVKAINGQVKAPPPTPAQTGGYMGYGA